MDVAGARVLAARIAEHNARVLERPGKPGEGDGHAPQGVDVVRVTARPAAEARDLRMYTADVHFEEIDGRSSPVTVVRCRRVVDGEWQSRVVEVDAGPLRHFR